MTTVPGTAGTPTYSGNTQTIVTTYGDGTTATANNTATGSTVTWAADHITKTTTYTFANGGTNPVVTTVPGTAGTPTYSGNTQTIVTTYGDGTTATANNTATGSTVAWAADHVTKTTTYSYANGGTNSVVATVPGTAATTYSGNTQTIVTTYGDGTSATATNNATASAVTWAADHITKTTTYTFANGGTNPVVTTVQGTVSTPVLAAAVYPANWTTVGTVIAPLVSSVSTTYGDGFVSTSQDGTSAKPFLQTTLAALSTPVTDPNANVSSTTTTYDLTWGTPDKNGPTYSALFSNGSVSQITLGSTMNIWGNTVGGVFSVGPTIGTPHPDVISAWQSGWTGKGINVVMEDSLTEVGKNPVHAITTTLLASRYAIASNFYGFNMTTGLGIYNLNGSAAVPNSLTNIGVVNSSWGENIAAYVGHSAPFTNTELINAYTAFTNTGTTAAAINRYTGVTSLGNFNYTDAVIVKSAGNDSVVANLDGLGYNLAHNANINPRLLIVGALNSSGFTNNPASMAWYSNKAGSDTLVQSRFILANGNTPFDTGWMSVNGTAVSGTSFDPNGNPLSDTGTSYAAPRIAGFVAILRQKFPNLNGEKSASVLLDTARYDTLSCYYQSAGCDPAIYGKGEASLSRALAPVGRLR